jgi:hypothetical protein
MHAPLEVHARFPITIPKQWYRGTGMQTRSSSVYASSCARKWALLRML